MNTIDEKHIFIFYPTISVSETETNLVFDFLFDQSKIQLLNAHLLMNDNQIEKQKHHQQQQQQHQWKWDRLFGGN